MVMGHSQIWAPWVVDDIHAKAEVGRYRVRGFSTFQKVTHFDDLVFDGIRFQRRVGRC